MMRSNFKTIDEYIASFPEEVQQKLAKIRQTVKDLVPQAQEAMSYQIPTFKLHGNLVHFGAYKSHIGFYPGPAAVSAFESELKAYKTTKGTIQFPLDQPVPYELITKIVKYCVAQVS